MKSYTVLLFILLTSVNLHAQEAREIIQSSMDVVKVASFEATSSLLIKDGKGNERLRENTMASKTYQDGTEKRIIKFTYPAEVKGTGILIFDYEDKNDDMWIYLPALRKTRRIVSSEKSSAFMGSEFSNADMTAPSIEDFSYTIIGSESIDGIECWKIESVPKSIDLEEDYGFAKSLSFIGKNDYIRRQTDYYNAFGEVFKRIRTLEFKLLDPASEKYMITAMTAVNLENGRSSEMKMNQVQLRSTDDAYFTVAYLER